MMMMIDDDDDADDDDDNDEYHHHRAVSFHRYGIFYAAWGWLSQYTGPTIILDSKPVMCSDRI